MLTLRPTTLADLPILQFWDTQPHVIESGVEGWEWEKELGRNPSWREWLIAELENRPIGFIQLLNPAEEESHYWGEVESTLRAIDIWIGDKEMLGKGYGTLMMQQAFERCFADPGVDEILIDPLISNVRAHKFYERLGFTFIRYQTFEGDACRVYGLSRTRWLAGK